LEKLRSAAFDDEVTDFTQLVDQADLGRDRTIGALLEFRQRLLQAAPINELQPTSTRGSQLSLQGRSPPITSSNESSSDLAPPAPARHHKTWTREYSSSREASGEEDAASGADDGHFHSHRKRHGSLLGFLSRHHRSHSGGKEDTPRIEETRHPSTSHTSIPFHPPKQCDASQHSPSSTSQPEARFTYQAWEDDPAEIWGAKPHASERRDTVIAPDAASPNQTPPISMSIARSYSGAALHHALTHAHSSTTIPTPTPENDYLGFCKSAWKLQNGDHKAMQRCREFNDGWSHATVYYLACAHSKCAFAGHIDVSKIWAKVWNVAAKGIKFRWSFLAKSHVPQQKVKDHQYAYKCMFCVFTGDPSPVYFGTDTLLDHVQGHRGQQMGDVILYKAKCVADRVAGDEEEFDVNLFPVSGGGGRDRQADRKKSEVLSDELLSGPAKRSTDAQDSMFTPNEPWNEGLSDFHWDGGLERTELE